MANVAGSEQKRAAIAALNDIAASGDLNGVLRAMRRLIGFPAICTGASCGARWDARSEHSARIAIQPCRVRHGTFRWWQTGGPACGAAHGVSNAPRKGLEFDHAVLLDADRHDRMNLYVALTPRVLDPDCPVCRIDGQPSGRPPVT